MSTPLRRVLIHPDPLRLESELVALIQDRQSAGHGLPDPTLVLAPTRRLVERLRRVLAGAFPGLLGVEVLHCQGLVVSVRTRRAPLGAPRPLLEALVRECAEREATPLAAYLAPRPRAVRRLTGLFGELREAGLDRLPDADPDLARLYAAYQEALAQLQTPLGGWTDRAGLAQHAMAALGPRPGRVIVYGAHELIGSNLALVDALRPERGTVFLLPVDADAPGWAHARAFIANHLRATPEPLPDPGDERPHLALGRALFSETAHAAPPQALRLVHAQGPEAELTFAARQALAWVCENPAYTTASVVAHAPRTSATAVSM